MNPAPALNSGPRPRPRPKRVLPLTRALALALTCAFACSASAATHTWQGPTLGNWSDAGNWSTDQIPDAIDDIAVINNTDAAGTDIQIAFSAAAPVTIGRINVTHSSWANSVVIGATANATDSLTLATSSGQPTLSVAGGTLKINAPLLGTQGFAKTGSGTLSFRENLHAQTYTGAISLLGGTLEIDADSDLGAADNDLLVTGSSTLLAASADPAVPLLLGSGRGIQLSAKTDTLFLANADSARALEITSQISGAGSLVLRGPGALTLSGDNTFSGRIIYSAWQPGTGLNRSSLLKFVGPGALSEAGHSLSIKYNVNDGPGGVVSPMRIDLGGLARRLHLDYDASIPTTVVEFSNGELISDGALAQTAILDASTTRTGSNFELRLSAKTTLDRHSLQIGTKQVTSSTPSTTPTARVRIGTRADFNLHQLRLGEGGSSGRLDALAPGATLRLRDGNGTGSLPALQIGNFYSGNVTSASAVLDLADGVIDASVGSIYIGNGSPTYPVTAALRIGAGTLQTRDLTLGGGNSYNTAVNRDYFVEQTGGETRISGTLRFSDGNATGNVFSRYILRGGTLALRELNATGNFTGTLRPRLEWSGGTLRSYSGSIMAFSGPNSTATPFEIVLSGDAPKVIHMDTLDSLNIPHTFKLTNIDPEVVLTKTGSGRLLFSAQTEGFTGTLQLAAGGLSLSSASASATLHAGSFVWDAGTLGFTIAHSPTPSNRLQLVGALTKTPAPASARVLALSGSFADATHTLATYASTDLTLDDFTVTGVPANTAAEFTVGPTALTVTLHFPAGFTKWRGIYFPSASNLGPAHDLADPDLDGRANLLEYALGSEPLAADSAAPVVIARDPVADRLTLTFSRIADPALTYTVRAANDPSGPWSGEGSETVFTSTGADNLAGTVTAPDTQPLSLHPRRFLRLFVTR